jgi:hypothetical protein
MNWRFEMASKLRIRFTLPAVLIGLALVGCAGEVQLQLRDAAVSAAATFVEQQTLELLNAAFGGAEEQ